MILTHLRVHCRWLWRLLTPRQWSRLPHVAIGATAYACVVTGAWFMPPLLADWRCRNRGDWRCSLLVWPA